MKFKMEIEIGNDAMHTYHELAQALDGVSHHLDQLSGLMDLANLKGDKKLEAPIRDHNGNKVGSWEISKE